MVTSIFFAVLIRVNTKIIHKNTLGPLGTADEMENTILRNIILDTITKHIEPNIRHQPVNRSKVLRLPPMAKANGAHMVKTAKITYRSKISTMNLNIWNMTNKSQIITKSQAAVIEPKISAPGN